MSQTAAATYVMGHNDRERRRLALQGSILNPFTEHLLRRAGISSGMHVLDIGCGIGDVSLMTAAIVGRHGTVTSIDIDPDSLRIARERAAGSVLNNITFIQAGAADYQSTRSFDAVTGRHILVHLPDPMSIIRRVFEFLHAGGVAVFHEFDLSVIHPSYPPCQFHARIVSAFRDLFCADGQSGIGTRLFHMLLETGFTTPDCRVEYPIDGGPDCLFYEWLAETIRSMYPHMKAKGLLEDIKESDLDTLAERIRDEAVSQRASFAAPVMIGAFARKPS
jgi:SAM-dependent methyltransferase